MLDNLNRGKTHTVLQIIKNELENERKVTYSDIEADKFAVNDIVENLEVIHYKPTNWDEVDKYLSSLSTEQVYNGVVIC